ncbi:CENP-Q, a CENPA-CAD centromere complex subunit-domain-containing protein [Triangularia setosa]|uniref:CENP-Q, a CENPA-CAD centromere complex subunit-domain-containing protein n=1 Tax=Triangularia setosa TaxID=2587417 RepID=A0AAN6W5A0_9PEZI|nr:CENP-Q, a CENPA-CAD centromere complex subunit-domain-containing protein [Podospora setosa]
MAPDEPNQKRKRGRPAGASKPDENLSTRGVEAVQQNSRDDNVEAQTAPKRRGRPRKSDKSLPEEPAPEPSPAAEEKAPKRKGRLRKKPETAESDGVSVVEEESTQPVDTWETAPRRRGRPLQTQGFEEEAEDSAARADESSSTEPKKRGRKPRSLEVEASLEETSIPEAEEPAVAEPEESPNSRRKRGRPAKSQDAGPDEPEQSETRPRKRAKAAETVEEQQQQEEPRGRGRSGRKAAPTQQEDTELQDAEPTETDGRRRRKGRIFNEDASREEAEAEPEPQNKKKSAKNGSKSNGRLEPVVEQEEETQEEGQYSVRRGGRGQKSAENAAQAYPESNNQAQKRSSKKGPRGTLTKVSVSEAQNQTTSSSKQQSKKKIQQQPQPKAEEAEEPPQSPLQDTLSKAPYRHLAPKTLHIPRSTIRSKWTPLDPAAIATIDSLILDSYIPVLESLGTNSTRYTQSQTILRTFASRLHNKLVKGMPFPPATIGTKTTKGVSISAQEAELNFEKVLDASSHLQRQLDPVLHSVELLKTEKEREEAMLEQDYKNLRKLEENARAQARGWRERGKRDHVLAPGRKDNSTTGWDADEERGLEVVIKTEEERQVRGSVFEGVGEDREGEELVGLANQIGNHMESMRGNLGQIEGVVPAIQRSRAALQGVLGRYLSEEAYEGVVLG